MKLCDLTAETEGTFFRCLHDEKPDDPRVIEMRRRWYAKFRPLGLRAKVLIEDSGEVVGLCQYLPVEHSGFIGEGLMAILCMWVHGYEHHVGDRQGCGLGRFMLEAIEADARAAGAKGVAAWGKDFPYWNPVSFYEHMGYVRADQDGTNVLVWKAFDSDVAVPKLPRVSRSMPAGEKTVNVTVFIDGWCSGGVGCCVQAREAVAALGEIVSYEEVDTSDRAKMRQCGAVFDGIYLDGEPYDPDGPPRTTDQLIADIRQRHEEKSG